MLLNPLKSKKEPGAGVSKQTFYQCFMPDEVKNNIPRI